MVVRESGSTVISAAVSIPIEILAGDSRGVRRMTVSFKKGLLIIVAAIWEASCTYFPLMSSSAIVLVIILAASGDAMLLTKITSCSSS